MASPVPVVDGSQQAQQLLAGLGRSAPAGRLLGQVEHLGDLPERQPLFGPQQQGRPNSLAAAGTRARPAEALPAAPPDFSAFLRRPRRRGPPGHRAAVRGRGRRRGAGWRSCCGRCGTTRPQSSCPAESRAAPANALRNVSCVSTPRPCGGRAPGRYNQRYRRSQYTSTSEAKAGRSPFWAGADPPLLPRLGRSGESPGEATHGSPRTRARRLLRGRRGGGMGNPSNCTACGRGPPYQG